ncbi:hypothetical protein, partial [Xanthomonas fragariae]|uniref:hypothetical protein n=1 Tax=Xanthomonas fragariae TaxID=48664 RepID=UPI001F2E8E88
MFRPSLDKEGGGNFINEVNCFQTSAAFLSFGVIAYLLSKGVAYDAFLTSFGFIGSGISLFSVLINSK